MQLIIFLATMLSLVSSPGFAATTQKSCFDVSGMTCAACAITLKTAVKKLKGINSVKASVEEKDAVVEFDPNGTSIDEIKKAIDSTGYKATNKQCKA